jgi:hypothetical protein
MEGGAMLTQERVEVVSHDVIEVVARRVGDVPRTGEILEVLGAPDHPHYRVCAATTDRDQERPRCRAAHRRRR